MTLERATKEGNSPVDENGFMLLDILPAASHLATNNHEFWRFAPH